MGCIGVRVNLSVKNIVIIVCAVIAAIVAAVVGAISVVKLVEKAMANTDGDYISAISSVSDTFTSLPVSIEEPDVPENGLVITSPSKLDTTVTYSKTVISGTSDSAYPVIMNGEELERGADGSFAKEVELNIGENKFIFEHKGKQTVCIIRYRYIVINSYSPSNRQKFSSGSTFVVSVSARPGSSVTATFNGKTINLSQETGNTDNEFVSFTGSFSLPSENDSDLNMGKVKFVGSYNGITETFNSGNIICLKNEYISNSPYIAEVVAFTAETFTGSTTDDYSDPRNNYLPKGTVDYCESGLIYDSKSGNQYAKLRCGRRVYLEKSTDDYSQNCCGKSI